MRIGIEDRAKRHKAKDMDFTSGNREPRGMLLKVFKAAHMLKTANCFEEYAKDMEAAIAGLNGLEAHINDHYSGQATPIVEAVIQKLREHMELLQSCGENTNLYIAFVIVQVLGFDKRMAS